MVWKATGAGKRLHEYMDMNTWRIMCEECDTETHVLSEEYVEISFCPACGRRVEPEDLSEGDDI